jgi:hypothetical protein
MKRRFPALCVRLAQLVYNSEIKKKQNNFIRCFVLVWHLVSYPTERTQTEGVREQDAEENIYTWEGWSGERLEKNTLGASYQFWSENLKRRDHLKTETLMRR